MRSIWPMAAATLVAGAVHAAPLTYAEALRRAEDSGPSVAAKVLLVDAARAAAIPAGALPDPKISFGVTDFPISGPLAGRPGADTFSMLSLGYSQEVPNRARRRARVQAAEADIGAALADQAAEIRAARTAAGQAWIELYYAERKLAALAPLETALAQEQEAAPARLAAGTGRPAQALEPQQARAGLADRREALRARVLEARADLERWIGPDPAAEPAGPPPDLDLDPEALRARLDALPAMRAAAAKVRQAEDAADEAKADKHPDWGYQVQYDHRDPRFGDYVSGRVNLTLPLFASSRQDPIIAARLAQLNAAVAEQAAIRRQLQAGLESGLAEHVMHHAQLARAHEVLAPLARRRADLETASYRGQTASLTDVFAARRDEIEADLDVLDREAETAAHVVTLVLTYGAEQP